MSDSADNKLLAAACVLALLSGGLVMFMRGGGGPGGGPLPEGKPPAALTKVLLGLRLKIDDDQKHLVCAEVLEGGNAHKAGVRDGDRLLAIAGQDLSVKEGDIEGTFSPIFKVLGGLTEGEVVLLRLERKGKPGTSEEVEVRFITGQGEGHEPGLARKLIAEGVYQLLASRRADGLWPHYQDPTRPSVGVTALAAYALARAREHLDGEQRQALAATLARLLAARGKDGGLVDPAAPVPHRVYATSLLCLALAADAAQAGRAPPSELQGLASWLQAAQVQEAQGYDAIDARYGGWPYYEAYQSTSLRTDVSTARFALQGLRAAALPGGDAAWQRAALWLDLAQNLGATTEPGTPQGRTERQLRDGGFAFGPRMSKAGEEPVGEELVVYRSYGSATADGALSLLAVLGIDRSREVTPELPDDERLRAALGWLARHHDLTRTPGFAQDPVGWGLGLRLYYLAALAEALHRAGVWTLLGTDRSAHVWAAELVNQLGSMHGRDRRSFQGASGLMHEDAPSIASAFALLALCAARERLLLKGGATLEAGAPPPRPPAEPEVAALPEDAVRQGALLFARKACTACHQDQGRANGPSLVGIGDVYLAELKTLARAQERLSRYIREPQRTRPLAPAEPSGVAMPPFGPSQIKDAELEAIVAFLLSRTGRLPVSAPRPQ